VIVRTFLSRTLTIEGPVALAARQAGHLTRVWL
jgi:hypothetical protein